MHDSFIVQEQYEDRLRDAMYEAFEETCRTTTGIKMQARLTDLPVSQSHLENLNSGDPAHMKEYSGYYLRDLEFRRELKERCKKEASI